MTLPVYRKYGEEGYDHGRPRKSEPKGTAQLKVEVNFEVNVGQVIDLLGLFLHMGDRDKKRYQELDMSNYDQEWERPEAFLYPDESDANVDHIPSMSEIVSATWCDLDDFELRVRHRTGDEKWQAKSRWSEEDFQTLRDHVPWLDAFHKSLEIEDEDERDEDLARIPGPNDAPMF